MPLEGDLVVRIAWDGHRVQRVAVRSSRPFAAAGIMVGKTPSAVIATVPLLFSICAEAQSAAATSALTAANAANQTGRSGHELGVILETVQEYLRRFLIDWARATGREPIARPVAAARQAIAATMRGSNGEPARANGTAMRELACALRGIAAQHIYGMPPANWLGLDSADALEAWIARGLTPPAVMLSELLSTTPCLGSSDVELMPPIGTDALLDVVAPAMLREPDFARTPTWEGAPVETGALARMRSQALVRVIGERCGNSVATRMAARLAELAVLLEELDGARPAQSRVQALALGPGEGLAAVETARGLLLHRVLLTDGRVAEYQIVAPTEWNFHPEGALVRGLAALATDDESVLDQQVFMAVQALDPCVECRIEVGHA